MRPSAQTPSSVVSHTTVPPPGSGPAQALQPPHWQLPPHDRECSPQSPQSSVCPCPGAQGPWPTHPVQPLHWQLELQLRDWVPQLPHPPLWVCPGEHGPCPVHPPQPPHWPLELQVRFFVPHLPQDWVCCWPGAQSPPQGQVAQIPWGKLAETGLTSTQKHSLQPHPPPR